MPDIQAVSGILSSAKTALDLVKNMVDMRDDAKLRTLQADLQTQLLHVLSAAVDAKSMQLDLITREEALKKEIAELKEWNASASEYKREQIPVGAFAFVSQPPTHSDADEVWLCPKCYGQKQQGVFSYSGESKDRHSSVWTCLTCGEKILTEAGVRPGYWRHRAEQLRIAQEIDAAEQAKHTEALKKKRDQGDSNI